MTTLFDKNWMRKFQQEWNKDRELTNALQDIKFNSTIAYGFPNEDKPRGVITVNNGQIVDAGTYNNQALNWDLRAQQKHWHDWLGKEVGKASLGLAYSTGKLKFLSGDYKGMIRNPQLLKPFVKSFSVMGRI